MDNCDECKFWKLQIHQEPCKKCLADDEDFKYWEPIESIDCKAKEE